MDIIAQFDITPSKAIKILIPAFGEKENLFYEPIPKLHRYDIAQVVFQHDTQSYFIVEDMLVEIVPCLSSLFRSLMKYECQLQPSLKVGSVGSWYNYAMCHAMDKEHDLCLQHNVWPTSRWKKTFLYRNEDAYYLEIAPVYRWLYDNPPRDDEVVSFEEFMRTYQPCVVQELTKSSIITWLKHSEELIKFFSSGTTSEQERATV